MPSVWLFIFVFVLKTTSSTVLHNSIISISENSKVIHVRNWLELMHAPYIFFLYIIARSLTQKVFVLFERKIQIVL